MNAPVGGGARGLPCYLVLDTSRSMAPHVDLLNETLQDIYDTLATSPAMMDFIHLSIIAFNTNPQLVSGMISIETLQDEIPVVSCGGNTNFGPMFDKVRERIELDVPMLAEDRINVLRPVVFLLTDGEPTDDTSEVWREALGRLTDKQWRAHPHIISYGFGAASDNVLAEVATLAAYAADAGTRSSDALTKAMSSMLNSLVTSARSGQFQLPATIAGMRTVAMPHDDYVNEGG